jgi:hypothetical protein
MREALRLHADGKLYWRLAKLYLRMLLNMR